MSALPHKEDPTLAAVDAALVARDPEPDRPYLGASALGKPCDRALWYAFRWARETRLSAIAIKAIEDGHQGERVMADRLQAVPGIQLWIEDENGQQIGFEDLNGHLRGHVDGVIQGLLQAPKTAHIWEHKQVNDKKFAKLKTLAATNEKAALEAWDGVYFVQAQLYMHYLELTRHYLTCSTPGGREQVSCRTDYQREVAEWAIERARRIIDAARPPLRVSDDPDWFECRYCDYHPICHGKELPRVQCRTCAYSTAQLAGDPWICEKRKIGLSVIEQRHGCPDHLFLPDLFEKYAEVVDGDPQAGTITYRMRETGQEFKNGHRPSPDAKVFSSHEIRVAASGCQDVNAAVDWLDAASDPNVAAMRGAFDAHITRVEALEGQLLPRAESVSEMLTQAEQILSKAKKKRAEGTA